LFYISSASFFFTGLLDDKVEISANKKLFLICLVTFVYCTLDPSVQVNHVIFSTYLPSFTLNGFSIFATVLCFMLFMNAFNMFDGINLQSASYYLFFLCFLIYLFGFNFFLIVLMISCLFFLYLNYKNICFLGNNGSMYISFVLCVLTIKYNTNSNYIFFSDQIFLLMAIPGLELLRLAIFRIIKKKHPFKADQNHLHHLMLRSFGYAKTFFIIQFLIMSSNIIGVY
jgi:UDP-GlcNAc:undecaprenyl-phosphate GlcNAc-1-phosphate transferase